MTTIDDAYLIALPYRPTSPKVAPDWAYQPLKDRPQDIQMPLGKASNRRTKCEFDDLKSLEKCIKHTFRPEDGFNPVRIEINGRKGRRTCAVLGDDSRKLRIFDLDYTEDEAKDSLKAEALLNTERISDLTMTG
jgi:anaphase-promoting complex subunit 4